MSDEILVKVEGVSKKFCRDLKLSLWYGVKDIANEILGGRTLPRLRKKEFWAVRDVSFELKRGDCLGLIGHNGAGKSTLLKMLNGLIKPDVGLIAMTGRVGALIELGAGFNPILTGKENIYVNGQILGLTKKEIDRKLDDIIDFAELSGFVDTPVQNYSSGMKVRLGFAIAAQMEPDILIIDEVLAVGDIGFRIKCLNAITNLLSKTAIIFVSHSMPLIARICNKVMLLDHGNTTYYGATAGGIEKYFDVFDIETSTIQGDAIDVSRCDILSNGSLVGREDGAEISVKRNAEMATRITFIAKTKEIGQLRIDQTFYDREMRALATTHYTFSNIEQGRPNTIEIKDRVQFAPGLYSMSLIFYEVLSDQRLLTMAHYRAIRTFRIAGEQDISHAPLLLESHWTKL